MNKKIIIAALLGWVVLAIWTFIVNGILGFKVKTEMQQLPNEQQVYEMLTKSVTEPGKYVINPEQTDTGFPPNQPVYSISYAGFGHEKAGQESIIQIVLSFLAVLIACGMLSMTADRIIGNYVKKVLFFICIGLIFAFFAEMPKYGIGGYPLGNTILLAIHAVIQWTIVGLVVAWHMKVPVKRK